MYIKSFGINIDKSKRLWLVISMALLVAIILIIISFMFVFNNSNSNIIKLTDLFEANSYYAEYKVKVNSNKNENEYKIKEWYKKEGNNYNFRIETDNIRNNFIYYGNNNEICIKSDEQLSFLKLQEYNSKKNNILSISSIIDILYNLNEMIKEEKYEINTCCKIQEIQNDKDLIYIVNFGDLKENSKVCDICNKFLNSGMKITKIEIIIDNEKLIPKEFVVYNTSNEIYVDIVYNKFSINEEFDEKLFAF